MNTQELKDRYTGVYNYHKTLKALRDKDGVYNIREYFHV